MVTTGWGITIRRRDGSKYHLSNQHGRPPQVGEEIEIEDAARRTMLARIDSIHHAPLRRGGPIVSKISATEI